MTHLLAEIERHGWAKLSDRDVAELGKLYRAAANQLAQQRAFGASARRIATLNQLVARAHAVIYGRSVRRHGRRAWWLQLLLVPETVRKGWRYHLLALVLTVLAVLYGYHGAAADPDWSLSFVFGGDDRTVYASTEELLKSLMHGRAGEIGAGTKTAFAAVLWQHNTQIALMSFFLGFLAGVPTALLLIYNGAMLGTYTYTFQSHGLSWEWWAWILPHGITEIGAIVLLAGGGFQVGHRIIHPGHVTRAAALRALRADLVRLGGLAFPMLLIAALIESFERQSTLDEPERYAFAAATLVFWVGYLGFVRAGRGRVEQLRQPSSLARRNVPLPSDEEILGLLGRQ